MNFGNRFRTLPSRLGPALLVVLMALASSRLPVGPSTHRFGTERSKRTRTCPSEQSSGTLQVKTAPRTLGHSLPNEFARSLQHSPDASFQAISPSAACRLALGDRRPEYLKFFAPSSSPTSLPPPPA